MTVSTVTPRPAQAVAIPACVKALKKTGRALCVMATGLGKTFTAAFVAQRFRAKRTLFLVHNNFILDHARNEFALVFGERISMSFYNGMEKNGAEKADIVFATWQTMGNNLDKWKSNHFDLVIVDEAHHTEAATYRPSVDYFDAAKLAITATPDRQDDKDIREVFGREVVNIPLEEAIARGWLPRIEYHVVTDKSLNDKALQEIVAGIRDSKRRFTMDEINRRLFIRKRDVEIAEVVNGYAEKSLVFCPSISYAERFNRSLLLGATFHSKKGKSAKDSWKKNQAVLQKLRDGVLRRVCVVDAFNEGVDVPSVGLVVFCRCTQSPRIFRQQLGRGCRAGKEKLIVLDFVGNLERIQIVRDMMERIKKFAGENDAQQSWEVSGAGFEFTFSEKIVDLVKVLEHCQLEFYPTWQEASAAAKKLGITSRSKYRSRYKEDPRLPVAPNQVYLDFPGFGIFLATDRCQRKCCYKTWSEASVASVRMKIRNGEDYQARYKEDALLPSRPNSRYKDFPGWKTFLRMRYPTWQEAAVAAQKLGIKTCKEYPSKYKGDRLLPSAPNSEYQDFPSWGVFLGSGNGQSDYYSTWEDAGAAARGLGIKTSMEYKSGCKRKDARLPSHPEKIYPNFPGWPKFLGRK